MLQILGSSSALYLALCTRNSNELNLNLEDAWIGRSLCLYLFNKTFSIGSNYQQLLIQGVSYISHSSGQPATHMALSANLNLNHFRFRSRTGTLDIAGTWEFQEDRTES